MSFAVPAHATGGYLCKTADGSAVELSVGFGHVPGAPIVAKQLRVKGSVIPITIPQWWLDRNEMRLLATDPDGTGVLARLRARIRPNGYHYDGTLEWAGKRRWVRCEQA